MLPLGISFFTFQQIAYLVDCYKGKASDSSIREYALFVTFFPQLIAGPIVHHREMLSQFQHPQRVTDIMFAHGLFLLVAGLAKKVLIADSLAPWVDAGFAHPEGIGFADAWISTLAYTFQLYFDFSGYSEMAMGLAFLFGIALPKNFDSPYKATNIADFWRRWHMTLGRFLRQYLYIPLGGNRFGAPRTVAALSVTMILGGLWHGAGWTFIVWGILHGLFLSLYYLWQRQPVRLPPFAAQLLTFTVVLVAWVPFRAASIGDAMEIWSGMLGLNGVSAPPLFAAMFGDLGIQFAAVRGSFVGWEIGVLLFGVLFVLTQKNVHQLWENFKPNWQSWGAVTATAIASVAIIGRESAWLYGAF